MKILHSESSLGWGGQERRILLCMEAARKQGCAVHLVCQSGSLIAGKVAAKGFAVHLVSMDPWFSVRTLLLLARLLGRERFDIVHTHSSADSWAVGLMAKCFVRPSPKVVRTRHLSTPLRGKWVYTHLSDRIITTGTSIREYLIHRGINPAKVLSIPTGVDVNRYSFSPEKRHKFRREMAADDNTVLIGNVAVLRSWKGHDDFLEVANRVHALFPAAQFVIVGDGPQRERLQKRAALEDMTSYLRFTGHREDVADILCGLDIFLFTSYANEGVPQAVSQAMACARPVVATRVGSVGDVMEDEKTGFLVETRDIPSLVERVIALLKDPEMATRMGHAGRQKIISHFTLEQMEEKIMRVYGDVMNEPRRKKACRVRSGGGCSERTATPCMRIALIRQKVSPRGGAEGVTYRLADELTKRGHEVHVLAAAWENPLSGVSYHRMPLGGGVSWLKTLSFQRSVQKFLAANHFDVVCGLDRTFPVDIYRAGDGSHRAWLAHAGSKMSPWRRVLLWMDPKNWILLWLERQIFRHPSLRKVIANSEMVRRELMEYHGMDAEKILTVHNGVDLSKCDAPSSPQERIACKRALRLNEGDTVLLFLGSNYERKGLKYLLEAVARHKDRPITLLVAGKGREKKYHRLSRRYGIAEKIRWMGLTDDPSSLYRSSDLFILPTSYDPFSNVCLEAMAFGLPLITTPANGASEAVLADETGWVVEPEETSKALTMALQADLWQMGRSALAHARDYPLETQVQKTWEVFTHSASPSLAKSF